MDGLWSNGIASEQVQQSGVSRHRLLRVNTDVPTSPPDASGYAAMTPTNATAVAPFGHEGGPHFILSPETPDGRPTLGFEWFLTTNQVAVLPAIPGVGGFDVTIWVLVSNFQAPLGFTTGPTWVSFKTETGVALDSLYHTFDVNATAVRFQIANVLTDGPLIIGICEL